MQLFDGEISDLDVRESFLDGGGESSPGDEFTYLRCHLDQLVRDVPLAGSLGAPCVSVEGRGMSKEGHFDFGLGDFGYNTDDVGVIPITEFADFDARFVVYFQVFEPGHTLYYARAGVDLNKKGIWGGRGTIGLYLLGSVRRGQMGTNPWL